MKTTFVALFLLVSAFYASASVTLTTQFGEARASNGSLVAANTLWILVVDSNASSSFAGGFALNSSLISGDANSAFTIGQSLSVGGALGGDTIFAMGGFSETGLTSDVLSLTIGQNGVQTNSNFAFYWFPGVTYVANSTTAIVGSQVGGIHASASSGAQLDSMIIPADGALSSPGAATSAYGGAVTNAQFTAVNLNAVPEPSTALLGAIGALALLRRRR